MNFEGTFSFETYIIIRVYLTEGGTHTNNICYTFIYFTFRIDKLSIQTNPVCKVVVTDNWIMMVGQWPWNFHLAHQSDVELKIVKTDHHQLSTDGQAGGAQYLSILVKNRRSNLESFSLSP